MHRQNLGEMLLASNLIDSVQMEIALEQQRQTGKRFGSTLVDLKFIDDNVLAAFLSKQMDVPCISLMRIDVPKKVLRKVSRDTAVACNAIPVRIDDDGRLEVAMIDPTDVDAISRLEKESAMTVSPLIAPESSLRTVLERFYPEDLEDDETLSVKQRPRRNDAADPVFWDFVAEMDSGDLHERLTRIEESLDRLWVLLEKVLRTLESREGAHHDR